MQDKRQDSRKAAKNAEKKTEIFGYRLSQISPDKRSPCPSGRRGGHDTEVKGKKPVAWVSTNEIKSLYFIQLFKFQFLFGHLNIVS